MLFQNQKKLYGRVFREESGGEGEPGGSGEGEGEGEGDSQAISKEAYEALQAKLDAEAAENQRLNAKIGEANKHKKEAERLAKQKERESLEQKGDYEQLHKSAMQELEREREEHQTLRDKISKRDERNEALRIAGTLAEGANIELLADFVQRRLKSTEEGIKVTNEAGELTVSSLEDLAKEFMGSARFSSLIKGSQSSGGSANGGSSDGSGAAKEIGRSDFNKLTPAEQMKFIREDGGTVIED